MAMMMSTSTRVVAVLALLGSAAGGFLWWQSRDVATDDTTLSLYGTVDVREVHLGFHEVEHIASVNVEEGDQVVAGQELARQDAALLEAQAKVAAAEVDARQAALDRLESGSRAEAVRKARADVEAAQASLRDAQASAARIERLVYRGAMDRQRGDDAKTAAQTARARLKALQAALDLVVAGPRKEDIDEGRALLARAKASLALVRERIDDTRMRASHDGVIRERILEVGDLASPVRPVFVLALSDPVWVRAYAPEPALGQLRDGMPAEVISDSFPHKRYAGWVGFVSPTAEFTPKSVHTENLRTSLVYQVRIIVCNPAHELRLGMPVTVRIPMPMASPADTIPPAQRCGEAATR